MLSLLLGACAPSPSAFSQPSLPGSLPEPPGVCEGFGVVAQRELGRTWVRGSTDAMHATATTWTTPAGAVSPPGEIHALATVGSASWAALGTAGIARRDGERLTVWPTPGDVVGLTVEPGGHAVWGADRLGRLIRVRADAAEGEAPEVRVVDGRPTGVAFDGTAQGTREPTTRVDGISALLALPDGGLLVGLDGSEAELVDLAPDLAVRARIAVPAPVTGLALAGDDVLVASRGLFHLRGETLVPFALGGEEVVGIAARSGTTAAWTPTRGLVWLDSDGAILGELPSPAQLPGADVAWRTGPVAVTLHAGRLFGPGIERALPMPASRVVGDGERTLVAMPAAGVGVLDGAGALTLHAMSPGAHDVAPDGSGFVAAVGTHGVARSNGARCDLPGTSRLVVRMRDGRFAVASDALITLIER